MSAIATGRMPPLPDLAKATPLQSISALAHVVFRMPTVCLKLQSARPAGSLNTVVLIISLQHSCMGKTENNIRDQSGRLQAGAGIRRVSAFEVYDTLSSRGIILVMEGHSNGT